MWLINRQRASAVDRYGSLPTSSCIFIDKRRWYVKSGNFYSNATIIDIGQRALIMATLKRKGFNMLILYVIGWYFVTFRMVENKFSSWHECYGFGIRAVDMRLWYTKSGNFYSNAAIIDLGHMSYIMTIARRKGFNMFICNLILLHPVTFWIVENKLSSWHKCYEFGIWAGVMRWWYTKSSNLWSNHFHVINSLLSYKLSRKLYATQQRYYTLMTYMPPNRHSQKR